LSTFWSHHLQQMNIKNLIQNPFQVLISFSGDPSWPCNRTSLWCILYHLKISDNRHLNSTKSKLVLLCNHVSICLLIYSIQVDPRYIST
jgi:hypothetical protein